MSEDTEQPGPEPAAGTPESGAAPPPRQRRHRTTTTPAQPHKEAWRAQRPRHQRHATQPAEAAGFRRPAHPPTSPPPSAPSPTHRRHRAPGRHRRDTRAVRPPRSRPPRSRSPTHRPPTRPIPVALRHLRPRAAFARQAAVLAPGGSRGRPRRRGHRGRRHRPGENNNSDNGSNITIHETSAAPGAAVLSGNVTIPQLVSKVIPAVVSIDVKSNGDEDEGTGMIITSNGEVLTNNHVIELYSQGATRGPSRSPSTARPRRCPPRSSATTSRRTWRCSRSTTRRTFPP